MRDQRFHLVIGKLKTGHSFIETAGADQSGDFGVGVRTYKAEDSRRTVGPIPIAAVANGATVPEGPGGDAGLLSCGSARHKKRATQCLEHAVPPTFGPNTPRRQAIAFLFLADPSSAPQH
jgi:hypothetical protein